MGLTEIQLVGIAVFVCEFEYACVCVRTPKCVLLCVWSTYVLTVLETLRPLITSIHITHIFTFFVSSSFPSLVPPLSSYLENHSVSGTVTQSKIAAVAGDYADGAHLAALLRRQPKGTESVILLHITNHCSYDQCSVAAKLFNGVRLYDIHMLNACFSALNRTVSCSFLFEFLA